MKRKIKRVAACVAFCILFVCCGKFFHFILVDDTKSYTRITFHEMYEQENIDTLFVGSSHCYRSFVPEILDRELGVNTFNAGTSNQKMDGSCMVIKEAAKYHDIKHIYLELFYNAAYSTYKTRKQMTETYIISDYMKPSVRKVKYLLGASSKQHYFNSFLPLRRQWTNFFDSELVKDIIQRKQSDTYKNYAYDYVTFENEWYEGKGYVADKRVVENWNFFSDEGWESVNPKKFTEDWYGSLEEIMDFCDKEGIELTFVVSPMSEFLLSALGNYDKYVDVIRGIADQRGIEYYDFNLCRENYFPVKSEWYKDPGHLNCYGAEAFSQLFADFINGKISEDELFYESYDEKIKDQQPAVFGVCYGNKGEGGEKTRKCKIVSNCSDRLEFKIELFPDGEAPYVIQDFSDNNTFTLKSDEKGDCKISYRLDGAADKVYTVNIEYKKEKN